MAREKLYKLIFYCFLGFLLYYISELLASSIIAFVFQYRGIDYSLFEAYIYNNYYMVDSLAMAIAMVIYTLFIKNRSTYYREFFDEAYLYKEGVRPRDVFKSTLVLMGIKGFINIWFIILGLLGQSIGFIDEAMLSFQEGAGSILYEEKYIFVFLSVVFLGPIVEELLFRGIIFGEIRNRSGRNKAVIISSLLFGAFHMDLVQMTYTILMGMVFAFLYDEYKSFGLAVYLHILNNLLETLPDTDWSYFIYDLTYVISGLCIIPTIIILINMKKREKLATSRK